MATTVTRIGSTASGAWNGYSFHVTGGPVTITVASLDASTGTVSSAYFTATQIANMNTIAAAFLATVDAGDYASAVGVLLGQLIGVATMDTTALDSSITVVGTVATLTVDVATDQYFVVYVPSEPDVGILISGAGSSSAPSGPAGGVLGYPGSTYPNPNGLAPSATVAPFGPVIPLKGDPNGSIIFIPVSPAAASGEIGTSIGLGSQQGGLDAASGTLSFIGFDGKSGTAVGDIPGTGGPVQIQSGSGGVSVDNAIPGGDAGGVAIAAGDGGNNTDAGGTGGDGAPILLTAGTGGTGTTGGDGGTISLNAGNGDTAGNVGLNAGSGTTSAGNVILTAGLGLAPNVQNGAVILAADTNTPANNSGRVITGGVSANRLQAVALTAATDTISVVNQSVVRLTTTAGVTITGAPFLPSGMEDSELVTLINVDTTAGHTITLNSDTHMKMTGGTVVLGVSGGNITFRWDSTLDFWVEVARCDTPA